jgi:hypothetical protein
LYGVALSDLTPLGGCALLEELGVKQSSLALLGGCAAQLPQLRKISLRRSDMSSLTPLLEACAQLRDLNLSYVGYDDEESEEDGMYDPRWDEEDSQLRACKASRRAACWSALTYAVAQV